MTVAMIRLVHEADLSGFNGAVASIFSTCDSDAVVDIDLSQQDRPRNNEQRDGKNSHSRIKPNGHDRVNQRAKESGNLPKEAKEAKEFSRTCFRNHLTEHGAGKS